jgi:hypothetical protein
MMTELVKELLQKVHCMPEKLLFVQYMIAVNRPPITEDLLKAIPTVWGRQGLKESKNT